MKTLLFLLSAIAISGCVTAPLQPFNYEQAAEIQTSYRAALTLNTGGTIGTGRNVYSALIIPINLGSRPELHYGKDDQKVFAESLVAALTGSKILVSVNDATNPIHLNILLDFIGTNHAHAYQEYTLEVAMKLETAESNRVYNYKVLSSEGDSKREKNRTSARGGKMKASTKLMNLIMRDLQNFLADQGA